MSICLRRREFIAGLGGAAGTAACRVTGADASARNASVGSIFHGPVNGCTGTTSMLTGPLGAVAAVVD